MGNEPEPDAPRGVVTQASIEGSSEEPSHAVSDLGARPAADLLVRRVARAKIAGALFARAEQVRLGRYHLLEMVGAGGMGVVWGAWDPELERRVAIKLLKATMDSARERILREGQALAKLAHPNVVPVYDVGVVDEQVYLVMEWVRGVNLRAFCSEPRTVKEVLAVYRAAGEGLAAAHRAGLIHRDFKPDNAILGDDERVRVLDFGLARGEVARSVEPATTSSDHDSGDLTVGAGTPRYMPPEQAKGSELTPAADQYAFCVSLREALVHRGGSGAAPAEVPTWIDAILGVGAAPAPDKRHASMEDVLRLLARDPARVWRNRLLVAGAVAATGTAFVIGSVRGASGPPPELERCAGGAEEIGRSWSPAVRSAMTANLEKLGPYGIAEARRLGDAFDRSRDAWAESHRDACLARETGTLTDPLYERNLGCLARARVALETAVELLQRADAARLPDTVAVVGRLPDPARCLTETQTSTNIPPPPPELAPRVTELSAAIERGRVLAIAYDPGAIAHAKATAEKAGAIGYLPIAARAQLEHGIALSQADKPILALPVLDEANRTAFEAGDDAAALEAYAYLIGELGKLDEADVPAPVRDRFGAVAMAESIGKRLGPSGSYVRALLFNNLGTVRLMAKDRPGARTWFARARDEQRLTSGHPELAWILMNSAVTTDDPRERDQLLAEGIREFARSLGPDHPFVLEGRVSNAKLVSDPGRAAAALREPCMRVAAQHPHLPERTASCRFELAYLAEERGDVAEARSAAADVAPTTQEGPIAHAMVLMFDGKLAEAIAEVMRYVDARASSTNPFEQLRSADALLVAALAQARLDRKDDAIGLARRALAIYGRLPHLTTMAFYERRLARLRALLVRLAPRDPAAPELAREALAWYRAAGGYDRAIAELVRDGGR